jgi:acyl-coenzyme A thioesterase PaaI-like protein
MRGPGEDQQAEPAAAMQARVRASFARQAMMATLGAELVSIERGRVELTLPYSPRSWAFSAANSLSVRTP